MTQSTTTTGRYLGRLIKWNKERRFGFIRNFYDGSELFIHISDFVSLNGFSEKNMYIIYDISYNKARAKNYASSATIITNLTSFLISNFSQLDDSMSQSAGIWEELKTYDTNLSTQKYLIFNEIIPNRNKNDILRIFHYVDSVDLINSISRNQADILFDLEYLSVTTFKSVFLTKITENKAINYVKDELYTIYSQHGSHNIVSYYNETQNLLRNILNSALKIFLNNLDSPNFFDSLENWDLILRKCNNESLLLTIQLAHQDSSTQICIEKRIELIKYYNYLKFTPQEIENYISHFYENLIFLYFPYIRPEDKIKLFIKCYSIDKEKGRHLCKDTVLSLLDNSKNLIEENIIPALFKTIQNDVTLNEYIVYYHEIYRLLQDTENMEILFSIVVRGEMDVFQTLDSHITQIINNQEIKIILKKFFESRHEIISSSIDKIKKLTDLSIKLPFLEGIIADSDTISLEIFNRILDISEVNQEELYSIRNLLEAKNQDDVLIYLSRRSNLLDIDWQNLIRTNYRSEVNWDNKLIQVNTAYDLCFYILSVYSPDKPFTPNALWYFNHITKSLSSEPFVRIFNQGVFETCSGKSTLKAVPLLANGIGYFDPKHRTLELALGRSTNEQFDYTRKRLDKEIYKTFGKDIRQNLTAPQFNNDSFSITIKLSEQSKTQLQSLKSIIKTYAIIIYEKINNKQIGVDNNNDANNLYAIAKGNSKFICLEIQDIYSNEFYCSGQRWEPKKSRIKQPINWCDLFKCGCALSTPQKKINLARNLEIYSPFAGLEFNKFVYNDNHLEKHKDNLNSTSFITLFSKYYSVSNFNFENYSMLLGWLNEINRTCQKLHCRECGTFLSPKGSFYSARRVTTFECSNKNCSEFESTVYLNHCLSRSCKGIIDSRDSKQCSNGWYICSEPFCNSCCSTSALDNRKSMIEFTTGVHSIEKRIGHNDNDMWFCHKCGGTVIKDNEAGFSTCTSCNYSVTLPKNKI